MWTQSHIYGRCAEASEGRHKPGRGVGMWGAHLTASGCGQVWSDRLALKPYWGKPAVRNFRGGDGNAGIIEARTAPLPYPTSRYAPVSSALRLRSPAGAHDTAGSRDANVGEAQGHVLELPYLTTRSMTTAHSAYSSLPRKRFGRNLPHLATNRSRCPTYG